MASDTTHKIKVSHLLSIVVEVVKAAFVPDDAVDGADAGNVLLIADPILDQPEMWGHCDLSV